MFELLGAAAGVGALLYMAFIGQHTLRDWWSARKQKNSNSTAPVQSEKFHELLHNLPNPEYGQFVGRDVELKELMRQLCPYPHSQHAVITIDGVGGIGKSALALEVAHRYLRREGVASDECFDAIIWTSAKQTVLTAEGIQAKKYALRTLRDIFNMVATTLEREDINNADDEQRSNVIRKALTLQRTLLIIDNLETVDDEAVLEFLRDLPAPTKAIVTTRHRIDVAYPIRLKGMPKDDAILLMQQECKKKNANMSPDQMLILYERTGGVPLAMVWSIAKMGLGYSIESVIAKLGEPSSDIARFCFEDAGSMIRGKEAHTLLLALGLFATNGSREALGETAGLGKNVIGRDEGLVLLEKLSLVNKSGDRFSLLPLTKSYVIGELAADQMLKKTLARRWLDYLKTLCGDPQVAFFWRWKNDEFIEDGPNLLAAIDYAYENGNAEDVFILTFSATHYCDVVGLWFEKYELSKRALSLARTSGNPRTAARFFGDMGWLSQHWGKYDRAQEEFDESHQIFRSLEDQEGICSTVHFLSVVARKRGHFEKAEKFCQEGLGVANELNSDHLRAKVKSEYGKLMRDMNELDKAWEYLNDVKNWGESLVAGTPKDENITAGVWGHLAAVAIKRGEHQLAYDLCIKSLPFFEQKGTKSFVATLKHRMAIAEVAMGRKKDALKNACEALYWYKRLGMAPDVTIVEALIAKLGATCT